MKTANSTIWRRVFWWKLSDVRNVSEGWNFYELRMRKT
jgi:hypothetical protein